MKLTCHAWSATKKNTWNLGNHQIIYQLQMRSYILINHQYFLLVKFSAYTVSGYQSLSHFCSVRPQIHTCIHTWYKYIYVHIATPLHLLQHLHLWIFYNIFVDTFSLSIFPLYDKTSHCNSYTQAYTHTWLRRCIYLSIVACINTCTYSAHYNYVWLTLLRWTFFLACFFLKEARARGIAITKAKTAWVSHLTKHFRNPKIEQIKF